MCFPSSNAIATPQYLPKCFKERLLLHQLRLIHSHFKSLPCAEEKNPDVEQALTSHCSYDPRKVLGEMLLAAEDQGDGTCLIGVEYGESVMRQEIGIPGGRLYAKGFGMQSMSKWIRHTLCHTIYHDVDVENAHPTILLQMMDEMGHGGSFTGLQRVVQNRNSIKQETDKKGWQWEEMKKIILVLMFGGALPSKASSDFPWLLNLQMEFKNAADIISNCPKHSSLLRELKAWTPKGKRARVDTANPDSNLKFRLVSCVLQDIENKILQSCIMFLANEKGMSVEELVLCFDGFMLPKSQLQSVEPAFLEELSKWVKDNTAWKVKFAVKPMDKIMDISGLEPEFVPGQMVHSDYDACKIILSQQGHGQIAFRAEGQTYVLSPSTKKWVTGKEAFKEVIKEYCHIADFRDSKGNKYSHQAQGIRNITTAFHVPEDSSFPLRLHEASLYKTFWQDGVYDYRKGEFRAEGLEDMTAARVPRPYPKEAPAKEVLEQYKKTLFIDPLGEEVGTFYLRSMARAMAGHIEDKRWFVLYGMRDAGKGVLESALQSALGPEYVVPFNIKALQEKPNSEDAEYELKWVEGLRWGRVAISNETIEKKKLDASLSKKLISGGDPVRLRVPHGMPYCIVPQCTYVNNANDLFEASTSDAMETCIIVQSFVKFVKQGEYNAVKEVRDPSWRVADPDLKRKLKTPEIGDIIWHLLLSHYSKDVLKIPDCIKREAAAMKEEDCDDMDNVLERDFEVTGNKKDYVTSNEMQEVLRSRGYYAKGDLMKLWHKLRLKNNPAAGMFVDDGSIYVKGKKTRVWKGLKVATFGHREIRGVEI